MSVTSTHPEYNNNVYKWTVVRDVLKSNVKKYLIEVDPSDPIRTKRYKDAARLTNFTRKTKEGLVGAATRKDPEVAVPSYLEYVIEDATGNHLSLLRLNKEAVGEVLQSGRFGLLVDYPQAEKGLTAAQVAALSYQARIYRYPTESIINWQNTRIAGQEILSLVVLKEVFGEIGEDGFTWEKKTNYRVLRLVDGVYTQQVFDEDEAPLTEVMIPTKADGQPLNYIPFTFIGAEDNDAVVDSSPMYDLAELNVGHYRNSADYEESVHIMGQPTLMIATGMSTEEFNTANPNGVLIGARRGHNLGTGGHAFMLQAQPNTLAFEAMKQKEEQAVMVGARLLMRAGASETAEAVIVKQSGEDSVLGNIVQNVAQSIELALRWCAMFQSTTGESDEIIFTPNMKFFEEAVDPQLIMAELQLYNNGVIALKDVRTRLRHTGLISSDRTDEDIDSDIGMISPLSAGSFSLNPETGE